MPKAIVIPLYDHTTEAEVAEILEDLGRLQFSIDPYAVDLPALDPDALSRDRELRLTADELGIDLDFKRHSVRHDLHRPERPSEAAIRLAAEEEVGPCTCGGSGICLSCAIASIEGRDDALRNLDPIRYPETDDIRPAPES